MKMRMTTGRPVGALTMLAVCCGALATSSQTAYAGPPGQWTRITETNLANIAEVGLARTADGALHVAWLRQNGAKQGIMHSAIGLDGRLTAESPTPIVTDWAAVSNPDLILTPDGGLRIFFGGIRSTNAGETNQALNTATADASGAAWTLVEHKVAASSSAYASPIGAGSTKDGTPISTWATTGDLGVHFGINPDEPDQKYQAACCAYHPDVATDAVSGEVVLGWFSNATKQEGLYTQTISPQVGTRRAVPGSASNWEGQMYAASIDQRMAIAARVGAPGVYVAYGAGYPTTKSVNLWRHGSDTPMIVGMGQGGARHANIAAGPGGRLWVMWMRADRLYFTRSNMAVSRFGPIFSVEPPKRTNGIYKLKGEGSRGALDVFTHVNIQGDPNTSTWHTQMLPRLELSARPVVFAAAKGALVTFKVTDAGDPIAGATISVAGKTLTTNAQGVASTSLAKGKKGRFAARVTKAGYAPASVQVVGR